MKRKILFFAFALITAIPSAKANPYDDVKRLLAKEQPIEQSALPADNESPESEIETDLLKVMLKSRPSSLDLLIDVLTKEKPLETHAARALAYFSNDLFLDNHSNSRVQFELTEEGRRKLQQKLVDPGITNQCKGYLLIALGKLSATIECKTLLLKYLNDNEPLLKLCALKGLESYYLKSGSTMDAEVATTLCRYIGSESTAPKVREAMLNVVLACRAPVSIVLPVLIQSANTSDKRLRESLVDAIEVIAPNPSSPKCRAGRLGRKATELILERSHVRFLQASRELLSSQMLSEAAMRELQSLHLVEPENRIEQFDRNLKHAKQFSALRIDDVSVSRHSEKPDTMCVHVRGAVASVPEIEWKDALNSTPYSGLDRLSVFRMGPPIDSGYPFNFQFLILANKEETRIMEFRSYGSYGSMAPLQESVFATEQSAAMSLNNQPQTIEQSATSLVESVCRCLLDGSYISWFQSQKVLSENQQIAKAVLSKLQEGGWIYISDVERFAMVKMLQDERQLTAIVTDAPIASLPDGEGKIAVSIKGVVTARAGLAEPKTTSFTFKFVVDSKTDPTKPMIVGFEDSASNPNENVTRLKAYLDGSSLVSLLPKVPDVPANSSDKQYVKFAKECKEVYGRPDLARQYILKVIATTKDATLKRDAQAYLRTRLPKNNVSTTVIAKYLMANTMNGLRCPALAKHYYERCVAEDPRFEYAYYGLSEILLQERMHKEAEEMATRVTQINPEYLKGWLQLGECILARGDRVRAATAFKRVIELDPREAPAIKSYGL